MGARPPYWRAPTQGIRGNPQTNHTNFDERVNMFASYPVLRVAIYCLAVASQIASFFVAISNPDLSAAFVSTAGVLSTVAGVTALSNVSAAPNVAPDDEPAHRAE